MTTAAALERELERHRNPGALRRWLAKILPQRRRDWRDYVRTFEIDDPSRLGGPLFRARFGADPPDVPRHFVTAYFSPPDARVRDATVVAYVHHRAYEEVYLGGGMCVDERIYRRMPKWLFEAVRAEGGLATIVTRTAISMLDDSPACFGHVGESRARQADLRTGFVDTGRPHLMVFWRRELPEEEKQRLIDKVEAVGPF